MTAIQAGFFATWPGLTAKDVSNYLSKSEATTKGHLKQTRQNLRSTKPKSDTAHRAQVQATEPTNKVFVRIFDPSGQIYTDQTGRFPVTSSLGSKYIMILYDHDSNAILAKLLRSRTESELVRAYSILHTYLTTRGFKPKQQRLDNEAPAGLKNYMRQHQVNFQLVPPHVHRRNTAERAIGTFKDHFIAGLSSTHSDFPLHLWCRLLPQCIKTLNMMRPSRLNPKISADTLLNDIHDFNRTPMAPPGSKVIIHEKPTVRATWAPHGVDGWYLGPAPEHYCCYRVYVTKTAHERIADTVEFFHQQQAPSPATQIAKAALNLARILKDTPVPPPFEQLGTAQLEAIQQLSAILCKQANVNAPQQVTKPQTKRPKQGPPRVEPIPQPCHTMTSFDPQESIPIISPDSDSEDDDSSLCSAHSQPPKDIPPLPTADDISQHTRSKWTPPTHTAFAVIDKATGRSCENRHLISDQVTDQDPKTWERAFANKLGRLADGVGTRMPTGTGTIRFIKKEDMPRDRSATYGRIVVSIRPNKAEQCRVRLTVSGNLINYPFEVSTPTADLTTVKILFNSVVSTPGAKFISSDISNFYLNTHMPRREYMRLPIAIIPQEIIDQYDLMALVVDGYIYVEIIKGMYGLSQAGKLANEQLQDHLQTFGYSQTNTAGLWRHKHKDVVFSLVVDDFGIRYTREDDVNHLLQALETKYKITTDWSGTSYCGLTLAWDYANRAVTLSMPGYIQATLTKYQHPQPS